MGRIVVVGSKNVPMVLPSGEVTINSRKSGGRFALPSKNVPLLGYRWDTAKSTGLHTLTATVAPGSVVSNPVPLQGYGNVLLASNRTLFTPTTEFNVGTGDFTFALRCLWPDLAAQYGYAFILTGGSSGEVQMRMGDSGYGGRLQVMVQPNGGATLDTPLTRNDIANKWQHILFQRKAGVCTVFVQGQQQQLALGTGTTYQSSRVDTTALTGATTASVGWTNNTGNTYVAEFAFWNKAIATANFTPPVGSLF